MVFGNTDDLSRSGPINVGAVQAVSENVNNFLSIGGPGCIGIATPTISIRAQKSMNFAYSAR
jgi:hypothetical protein